MLNVVKCKFYMIQMVFMGLVLSDNGIGFVEDKVKVIVDVRELQSVLEVRSFLGLVNYNVCFILDFVIVVELL